MIFIITILLLAIDFYYLKNIAGRRLVGLRWWNEVDTQTGDGRWVFESADPETREVNATDKRYFWIALYAQPVLWILLAIFALVSLKFIWLTLCGESEACVVEDCVGVLTRHSYCACSYDYEYARVLEVRQVQPGEWLCVECDIWVWAGKEYCRRNYRWLVQAMSERDGLCCDKSGR